MTSETALHLAFIAMCVTALLIGGYHRWQAAQTREPLNRLEEGVWLLISLRLAGTLFWGVTLLWMFAPSLLAHAAVPLPAWLRWSGVLCAVLFLALFAWTLRTLGKNLTDTVVTRQQHTLVTNGPYQVVRHPFYGALALVIAATFLLSANAWFLGLGLVVLLLIGIRTPIEERKLAERFGAPYNDYRQRVGKFLPRWR